MKPKTIKSVISRKFDAWVATITDQNVRTLVQNNSICTGGAIASMLMNEKPNDFDFYFRDFATTKAVAEYYVAKFKKAKGYSENDPSIKIFEEADLEQPGSPRVKIVVKSRGVESADDNGGYQEPVEEDEAVKILDELESDKSKQEPEPVKEKEKYRPVFLSSNAISLSEDVQLVIRFYGSPDEIHANYDYVHVTNFWSSWDNNLVLKPEALIAILNKDLRYIGSRYPLCSLFRMRKFINRGWKITAGQVLKIALNLQRYDLKDAKVLEEQLVGVDVAFFHQLIETMRKEQGKTEAENFKIDETYLYQLVDRLM